MNSPQWNEQFSVGLDDVDEGHIGLFMHFNQICTAIEDGGSREQIESLLISLLSQAREHFLAEERLLASTSFPGSAAHAGLHRRLLTLCERYMQCYDQRQLGNSASLLHFFRVWLTRHIQMEDRAFSEWLRCNSRGQGQSCERTVVRPASILSRPPERLSTARAASA